MSVPYVTFMKHAELVTKNSSSSRPVLKGVYHDPDGSLIVTDSHRLYKAKNSHSLDGDQIIEPKTGAQIEGSYPQTNRLIPDGTDNKGVIHIEDVKQAIEGLKALLAAGLITPIGTKKPPKNSVRIDLFCDRDQKVFLQIDSSVFSASYFLAFSDSLESDYRMKFSAEYFLQSLMLFKDAGYQKVDLKVYGTLRPFIIVPPQDESLLALILPVRS